MTEYPKEVQELIEAVLDYTQNNGVSGADGESLVKAVRPFRKKNPKRVGYILTESGLSVSVNTVAAVELDDEVRARLGPTAGVKRNNVNDILIDSKIDKCARIMGLIAAAAVEVDE